MSEPRAVSPTLPLTLRVASGRPMGGAWHELNSLPSRSSKRTLAELQSLGRTPMTVTIVGPSGTGKTQMAHGIHEISSRREGPLLVENPGAMSESLAISELFGHERGAFTGAVQHRAGLLRTAHGGTLVVDELTKAPLVVQHALLNVLEGRPFRPSGSDRYIQVDVRIVALASTPLEAAVRDGQLVPDLYERLRTTVVRVQPLSARPDDVLAVAHTALLALYAKYGYQEEPTLSDELAHLLRSAEWPGNHRHVVGVVARVLATAAGAQVLTPAHLPALDLTESESPIRERFLSDYVNGVSAARGGPSRAAKHYGVDRSTIRRWQREIKPA